MSKRISPPRRLLRSAIATLVAVPLLVGGCTHTNTTTDPTGLENAAVDSGIEMPAATRPTTQSTQAPAAQSPVVKELVDRLGNSEVHVSAAPTKEQAQALANAVFVALENHDMDAGLALNFDEKQVRALYKPSIADIMAPGLRLAAERKWRDLERYVFGHTIHLDRIEVADLVLLAASTSLKKPTHQFPRVELYLLANDQPVLLVLGQVMAIDGALRYLTLDLKQL